MTLTATTNQEAGWFLGLDDETVYRIDKEILEEQFAKRLVLSPAALNLSVDEVSYRKYHRYLTEQSGCFVYIFPTPHSESDPERSEGEDEGSLIHLEILRPFCFAQSPQDEQSEL